MKSPRRYLMISLGFLLVAVFGTVAVWWLLQPAFLPEPISEPAGRPIPADDREAGELVPPAASGTSSEPDAIRPIPLSTLPLSTDQKARLERLGIDVETFVITPAMMACARRELGTEALRAIIAGTAPTVVQAMALYGCLRP